MKNKLLTFFFLEFRRSEQQIVEKDRFSTDAIMSVGMFWFDLNKRVYGHKQVGIKKDTHLHRNKKEPWNW